MEAVSNALRAAVSWLQDERCEAFGETGESQSALDIAAPRDSDLGCRAVHRDGKSHHLPETRAHARGPLEAARGGPC